MPAAESCGCSTSASRSAMSKGGSGRVELQPTTANGLDDVSSYARCEDIRSVDARRLTHRIGAVGLPEMSTVERTLSTFLEL